MESPDRRKLAGAFPHLSQNAASPTGLCTDSSTYLSPSRQDSSGTTVSVRYCCHVLQILREAKHGAPAGSNLPGLLVCGLYDLGPVIVGQIDPDQLPAKSLTLEAQIGLSAGKSRAPEAEVIQILSRHPAILLRSTV